MSAAVRQVKAVLPHLSNQEVENVLRYVGGDPDRAVEKFLEQGRGEPAAGGHRGSVAPPRGPAPDLRKNPEGWFRHFDPNGNGLEKHEVVNGLVQTLPGCDRSSVQSMVEALWPMFDTDKSGAICFREFNRRDGLRETLLAQMGQQGPPAAAWPPARPPVVHGYPAGAGGGRPSGPVVQGHVVGGPSGGGYPQPTAPGFRPGMPAARPPQAGGFPAGAAQPAPPSKGVPKLTGRRKAVMVGINYVGTQAQLRGCINDVHNMKDLLTKVMGWNSGNMQILTDDGRGHAPPTRSNIEAALRWLVQDAQPGDVLFFHFSGHGAQQEDPQGMEEDGMNETILPADFKNAGMITDDHLADITYRRLPEGVRFTAVMDCCHSGTGLDLPYTWTPHGWREETNPFHTLADVQMFSGCEDSDTSADATAYGRSGGAMTTAFCDVMRSNPGMSYSLLMKRLNDVMRSRGFSQRAQLTSSQRFGHERPFLLDDIIPNGNPSVGRTFRRRFPPQPRAMRGPLADMLGIGAAVVGGLILGDIAGDVVGGLLGGLFS